MWFKVDDGLHSHPKALDASLPALGLWTVAGSWSGANLTDGFIPAHAIPSLSRGKIELADELVAAGLWRKVKNGYRFHEWKQRNPTRAEVEDLRLTRAAAGRKGGISRGKQLSKQPSKQPSKHQANAQAVAKQNSSKGGLPPDPTRPDPLRGGGYNLQAAQTPVETPPPQSCSKHINTTDPIPPCGPCAEARRTHQTWQTQHPAPNPDTLRQTAFQEQITRNRRRLNGQACPRCDDTGWAPNPDGDTEPCDCPAATTAP